MPDRLHAQSARRPGRDGSFRLQRRHRRLWKQQTLLNIVKIRYMDLPVFMDGASHRQRLFDADGRHMNGTLSSNQAVQGDFASVGGQAIYTDRPTITYVPMTGEKFLRGLITPIDPKKVFFLLQSGYAADFILGMAVESLNGVRNRSTQAAHPRSGSGLPRALGIVARHPERRRVRNARRGGQGQRLDRRDLLRRDDLTPDIAEKANEIPPPPQDVAHREQVQHSPIPRCAARTMSWR
jgi:hypothetical protein